MIEERWVVIVDFPEYAISDHGRIKRIVPDQKGRLTGTVMRPSPDTDGYLQVNLFLNGKRHTRKIHKLVCRAFNGESPSDDHETAHGDGNRTNNDFENLRWATAKENAEDRDRHGRTARGDRHASQLRPGHLPSGDAHWSRMRPHQTTKGAAHGCAKLSDADVIAIRKDTRILKYISAQYGITPTTASYIKRRKTWRHIP